MALRGRPPHAALLIDVEDAELTGNDAVARARLWTPDAHVVRGTVPDLLAPAREHLAANTAKAEGRPGGVPAEGRRAVPGASRSLRAAMNRLYRSEPRKEGYDGVDA
jgi:hypothetical protein